MRLGCFRCWGEGSKKMTNPDVLPRCLSGQAGLRSDEIRMTNPDGIGTKK